MAGNGDFPPVAGFSPWSVKARRRKVVNAAAPKPDPRRTDWVQLEAHAYVFGCNRRTGLILPYLADQNFTLHIGKDYNPPSDAAPIRADYAAGSPFLSNYRVFLGHQDMCRRFLNSSPAPVALMFEDDAVPNCHNWTSVVNEAITTMRPGVDVLALYGRNYKKERFKVDYTIDNGRRQVLSLRPDVPQSEEDIGGKHHWHGSMAYLVTRAGAEKIAALPWEGIPCDIVFWDRTNFCGLHKGPFDHDRRQGSLLFPESCRPKI